MIFKEVSSERYHDMLGMLPPMWDSKGFLVGEPYSSHVCKITGKIEKSYMAFADFGGRYFECHCALTVAEFKAMTRDDIVPRVNA